MSTYVADESGAVISEDCLYGGCPCEREACECTCHIEAENRRLLRDLKRERFGYRSRHRKAA